VPQRQNLYLENMISEGSKFSRRTVNFNATFPQEFGNLFTGQGILLGNIGRREESPRQGNDAL
jgi:hypothetical protein